MAQITIKPEQTLSGIAQERKTSVEELARLNPTIQDVNKIYAGQTLNVPDDVPLAEPVIVSSDIAREQFDKDKKALELRENIPEQEVKEDTEEVKPIRIKSQNQSLQALAERANELIGQVSVTPEIQSQINRINQAEINRVAGLAKAREGADDENEELLSEGIAEARQAEKAQQDTLSELREMLSEARTSYAESFLPSEKEREIASKLNTLRTERQLLPLELRQQGISAPGIQAGQIEDERVRAIQEQNLLMELGLEQEARQAQQKFAEAQLGFIQDDIDTQFKVQEAIREQEQAIIDEARELRKESLDAMSDIVSSLEGLAWEDLDAETQIEVSGMAESFGIPINTLVSALRVAKQQQILDKAKKSTPSTQTERQAEKESQATSIINGYLREGRFDVKEDGTISPENYQRLRSIWAARIGDPDRFDEIFASRLLKEKDIPNDTGSGETTPSWSEIGI